MLITIENKNLRGTIDTFGGELISLTDGYFNYLWSGDDTYWNGRSPHLFPIIGTLYNNELKVDSQMFIIGKHGFLRNSEFALHERQKDSVILKLQSSDETLKSYPFRFIFYVTHRLTENGFVTSYKIVNEDSRNIYFNAGGHVGIRCPLCEGEKFSDYEITFSKAMTKGVYFPANDDPIERESIQPFFRNSNNLELSHDFFKQGPMIIDEVEAKSLILMSRIGKKGIRFSYKDYPVLALWTIGEKQAPYICLEPWHGLPAMVGDTEFIKKPYILELKPKEDRVLSYWLEII